jgi:tetratricopeptide (TPR) repeat protein
LMGCRAKSGETCEFHPPRLERNRTLRRLMMPLIAALCLTLIALGSQTRAAAAAPGQVAADLTDADAWIRQGLKLNADGQYQEALDAFLMAVTIDPNNAFAFFNLGTASALLGRYHEAAGYLSEAVRLSPDLLPAWSNLGAMYNLLHEPGPAVAAFRQVIRLAPKDAEAHYQCALALILTGDRAAARAEYEILRPLDPALADQLRQKLSLPGK